MNDGPPLPLARPAGCLSDLTLDECLAGEATATRAAAHLQSCARCQARLEQLRQDEHLPLPVAMRLLVRTQRAIGRRRLAIAAPLVAAAAALLLWLHLPPPRPAPRERLKGQASFMFSVYVRHQDGLVEAPSSPAYAHPGEAMRFALRTREPAQVCIVGIDSAGVVTPYVADGTHTRAVAAGSYVVPGSIVLDETEGAERLVALACREQRSVKDVIAAARAALDKAEHDPRRVEALPLPCAQATFLLEKSARP